MHVIKSPENASKFLVREPIKSSITTAIITLTIGQAELISHCLLKKEIKIKPI